MAAKKTAIKKTPARKARATAPAPEATPAPERASRSTFGVQGVRETWNSALAALNEAEADLERQARQLLADNRIDATDANTLRKTVGEAVERGRQNATKELEARLGRIQIRISDERRSLRRAIDEGVQSTLATFNIPSRKEVAELTQKVDALSRKIDGLRRAR